MILKLISFSFMDLLGCSIAVFKKDYVSVWQYNKRDNQAGIVKNMAPYRGKTAMNKLLVQVQIAKIGRINNLHDLNTFHIL